MTTCYKDSLWILMILWLKMYHGPYVEEQCNIHRECPSQHISFILWIILPPRLSSSVVHWSRRTADTEFVLINIKKSACSIREMIVSRARCVVENGNWKRNQKMIFWNMFPCYTYHRRIGVVKNTHPYFYCLEKRLRTTSLQNISWDIIRIHSKSKLSILVDQFDFWI